MKPTPLLLLILLAGCQPASPPDLAAEAESLLAADRAFADLSVATNPGTAFDAYMAPDGLLLPRTAQAVVERAAGIAAMFGENGDPGYVLSWQPQFAEVAQAGDMGWTWGQYQVEADGEQVASGKYLNVWKKQPDGQWKVRVDIGNLRPAAQ